MTRLFELSFNEILDDFIAIYEDQTGYTLERQDAERLIGQVCASNIFNFGSSFLSASAQIYLKNMTDTQLDDYGANFGEEGARLSSNPSKTTIRFTFNEPLSIATFIYADTVAVGSNDNGTFSFRVKEDIYLDSGLLYKDIEQEEFNEDGTNNGADANDIEIGEITTLDDSFESYSFVESIANVTESHSGADTETDSHYLDRLEKLPYSFSTAGAVPSYEFHCKAVDSSIVDTGLTKEAFDVFIWVLVKNFDGAYNLNIIGDGESQLSNLSLSGLTLDYMDEGILYWNLSTAGPIRRFSLYKDSAKTEFVASGLGGDGTIDIIEENGSGIAGSIDVAYTQNDTDTTNEIHGAMQAVYNVHNLMYPVVGESRKRPINDVVIVGLINQVDYIVSSVEIEIESNNIQTVTNMALQSINIYLDNIANRAGAVPDKSKLTGVLTGIDGVSKASVVFDSNPLIESYTKDKSNQYKGTFTSSNLSVTVPS